MNIEWSGVDRHGDRVIVTRQHAKLFLVDTVVGASSHPTLRTRFGPPVGM